ncbi:TadE/TadG family type IV pilus assembly protein [Bradyrhizobium jicamae]|uniref:TadE/TadG family type IV pilus assembly protein n=1 Tax=Bradyrhizobium jicamae TaxID=280332 RepID=UPI001BAB289E|nr:TadE/TadG family type IV pilus assembly protein [Bradyrhizobium jicamae]MBR0939091.1 pilus assembly protein [Bradyrhizobium jicamae]
MVEFTLFAPMLVAMAVYTMDYGLLVFNKMEVQNAAQAGAQYALTNNSYNSSAITTAVTGATRFTAVTATSSQFCGCPAATKVTYCAASCDLCGTGTCPVNVQGLYVTVTATPTTPYKPLIRYGLVNSSSYNISATSTVRLR